MRTTALVFPFLALVLPGCDAASDVNGTDVFAAVDLDEGELPELTDAELELVAAEIDADALDDDELDEDDRRRIDELADRLDSVDIEDAEALHQLDDIERELTAPRTSPRERGYGG